MSATPMLATPGSFGHYLYQLRGDIVMQSQISNQIASSRAAACWRSRLIVIAVILTVTTVASLVKSRRDPTARAHAGTLREPRHHDQ